jgi:hypothetical protein
MSGQTIPAAVIMQGDNDKHLKASAYLLGEVLRERDDKNVVVYAYPSDANKTKMDQAIKVFGVSTVINGSHEKNKTLADKLKDAAPDAIKKGIHTIFMPNTVDDFNESPQEIAKLVSLEAIDICQNAMSDAVKAKKPKDDVEAAKLTDGVRIMPAWRFQFMDQAHIENQIDQDVYKLKEIFKK